ncbi:MAG: hypothetical protein O3B47_01485 [bacterium]|nr:hypothetical protein [bacterium]
MKKYILGESNKDLEKWFRENIDWRLFIVYGVLIIVWVAYFGFKYLLNFDDYSEEQLVKESFTFIPPLGGIIFGVLSIWSHKSLIIAIMGGVLTWLLMPYFYEWIWPLL